MTAPRRYAVIGGGIVGLAVADLLARRDPGAAVTVVEKEPDWARHQTGRNSGVIHSGLYYPPGSHKAQMCRAGAAAMVRLAQDEGVAHEICGKLVVAVSEDELPGLDRLEQRGRDNGLTVTRLDAEGAREVEPHVRARAALHLPATGIIDYGGVCRALAGRLERAGARLLLGTEVLSGVERDGGVVLETTAGEVQADLVVSCAGLYADVVARRLGHEPGVQIVPFRGEYYELVPEASHLVRSLIYPVPDPAFPFLGVHLTRGIDGHVHAGPNAVLALAREGYTWRDVHPREVAATLAFPGLLRLARRHYRAGAMEMVRSLSTHQFGESLRRLVPAVRDADLRPAASGVRAQALRRDGSLVDDFAIERHGRVVHVLNAPSPAATAALDIAATVVTLALER